MVRRCSGSRLLQKVLDAAEEIPDVKSMYLHVQTSNELAKSFYEKFGFEVVDTIKNYYKRIDPPDCYILRKTFEPKKAEAASA